MLQTWRRRRSIVTSVMALIGIGAIVLAWFSIGRVPGEAVVNMAFFGLILPIGFYAVFTLVGWQRSLASGATPNRFIALCLRGQLGMLAPLLFMFFLIGLINNASHALDRHPAGPPASTVTWADTFDASVIRRACVSTVTKDVRAKGGDPAIMQTRIDKYCGCVMVGLQTSYTDKELEDLPSRTNAAQDPKYTRVIQQCQAADKT